MLVPAQWVEWFSRTGHRPGAPGGTHDHRLCTVVEPGHVPTVPAGHTEPCDPGLSGVCLWGTAPPVEELHVVLHRCVDRPGLVGVEHPAARVLTPGAQEGTLVWLESAELDRICESVTVMPVPDAPETGCGPWAYARLVPHLRPSTLLRGFTDGWMWLEYQPIYDVTSGRMWAAEALLRADHPVLGRVSPLVLVAAAAGWRVAHLLDLAVLGRAVEDRRATGGDWLVTVNLSPEAVQHEDFAAAAVEVLDTHGTPRDGVLFELCENLRAPAAPGVRRLGEMGLRCAVDDWPTGYATPRRLGLLRRILRVEAVKLDRGWVEAWCADGRHPDPQVDRLARSVFHHRGVRRIAEGVETTDQLARLTSGPMRVQLVQGYLLARPVPPEQIPGLRACPGGLLPEPALAV